MTPEQFTEKMKEIYAGTDKGYGKEPETHGAADKLMCELLRELGYAEGVEIFEKASKWYE